MRDAKPLVLVIEDDADAAFLIRRLLNKVECAFDVMHLSDGERALHFFTQLGAPGNEPARLPSLILLDIKMPKVNGFEVLAWIRTRIPTPLPVIMLTTSDDPTDRLKANQLGADAFVAKFPPVDELQGLLNKLLGGKPVAT